jgi:hypothetical protein
MGGLAGDKTVAMALFRKFAGMPEIPIILSGFEVELLVQGPLARNLESHHIYRVCSRWYAT